MSMVIKDTDYFLVQFAGTDHEVLRGPFSGADDAWRYLFGRDPTQEEIQQHEAARWSVVPAFSSTTPTE